MKLKLIHILILLCAVKITNSFGQRINPYLEYFTNQQLNGQINNTENYIHTSFKPILNPGNNLLEVIDSLKLTDRDLKMSQKFKKSWFYRKLRTEDLVDLKTPDFHIQLNPLLNLELKKDDLQTEGMYSNTRGLEIKGEIGKKIYFYTSFYENQAKFEPYVTDYIKLHLVVPGQGAPKFLENDEFDFSMATAFLHFAAFKFLNIQFGQSRQFIGEGYRSLVLSDNAFNYPFLRLAATFGKFQYTMLWTRSELFQGAYYNAHLRKYNALSYFSWIPKTGIELSLFESIEWPGNTTDQKNFTINLFNPVIFMRTIQYGLNDEKNIMIGFNGKFKLYRFSQIYTQCVLDRADFEQIANNNFAFQVGIKHFDLFHERLSHQKLFAQFEFNYISPYTYSWLDPKMAFTHYNQPIAHPTGTGLKESLIIISYHYKDISLRLQGGYTINSVDTANTNFGSDVFKPNGIFPGVVSHTGNQPGQGIRNKLFKINAELIYLINPAYNLQIFTQLVYRKNENELTDNNTMVISFGLRTNLNNIYYDF